MWLPHDVGASTERPFSAMKSGMKRPCEIINQEKISMGIICCSGIQDLVTLPAECGMAMSPMVFPGSIVPGQRDQLFFRGHVRPDKEQIIDSIPDKDGGVVICVIMIAVKGHINLAKDLSGFVGKPEIGNFSVILGFYNDLGFVR